jgi:hypothetical protein
VNELRGRFDDLVTSVRRIGPGTVLVRGALFVAALLAQLIAWPAGVVLGRTVLLLVVVALLPVLAPRTLMVTLSIFAAVLGWLVSTTAYGEGLTYWRLVVLAGAVYLTHTLAALATVLPYDAVLSPGVLSRWLLRAGAVVALTAVVALFALLVPVYLGTHRYLAASLVGLALTIAVAGYLAALARRR